jgi:hypothetical protein
MAVTIRKEIHVLVLMEGMKADVFVLTRVGICVHQEELTFEDKSLLYEK